jgi:PIN domain nuclease of toxin-antitoxin system
VGDRATSLAGIFRADPADRVIVATALMLGVTVVTGDRARLDHAAGGYVEAIAC